MINVFRVIDIDQSDFSALFLLTSSKITRQTHIFIRITSSSVRCSLFLAFSFISLNRAFSRNRQRQWRFFLFTMKTQARVERSMLFEKSQSRCMGVSLKGNFRPRFLASDPFFLTTFNDRAICICRVCENVPFWKKKRASDIAFFSRMRNDLWSDAVFFHLPLARERLLRSSRSETASSQKRHVRARIHAYESVHSLE